MNLLQGKLSDMLRGLFGMDVGDWPASRPPEEITDMPTSHYHGIEIIGRHRKEDKKSTS